MPLSVTGAGERTATVARSLPRRQPKATLQYVQLDILAGFDPSTTAAIGLAILGASTLSGGRSLASPAGFLSG